MGNGNRLVPSTRACWVSRTEEKFKNDSAQTLRHVGERCLEKTGTVLVAFDGDGYIIVNLEYKNSLFQAWLPNDGVEGGGVVCCSPWHQLQLLQPLQNRRERRKSATSGEGWTKRNGRINQYSKETSVRWPSKTQLAAGLCGAHIDGVWVETTPDITMTLLKRR